MRRPLLAALLALLALTAAATPANAAFGLKEFNVEFQNEDESPVTTAGSHPFAVKTDFALNTFKNSEEEIPEDALKDFQIELPAGMVGDLGAVGRCSAATFIDSARPGGEQCPDGAAVGRTSAVVGVKEPEVFTRPLYNLDPPPGTLVKLGFVVTGVPVTLEATLKDTYPYNAVLTASNVSQGVNVYGASATVWGYPGDPVHDTERGSCLGLHGESFGKCEVSIPKRPFITLPRSCGTPLITRARVDSWQAPTTVLPYSDETPALSGCASLGLDTELDVHPSAAQVETPTGLELGLDVKDKGLTNPTERAGSDLKALSLTMPQGMTANPSLAEGLETCSKAGLAAETLTSQPDQGCPQAAKVGTVELESPLIQGELLKGEVFLATQDDPATPGAENPFDSLLAAYIVIKDQDLGILVKQAVKLEPDPITGRLTTLAGLPGSEIPQLPFSHLRLHLHQGSRAPLVNPPSCGTHQANALFTPWANPQGLLGENPSFSLSQGIGGGPCPPPSPPFTPELAAGSLNNTAGAYSPFNLRIARDDGEQELSAFALTLPPGLVAKLAGVGKCSDAQIAAARTRSGRAERATPSCPASAQIGRVLGAAGVGSALTYVPGALYLAGPFAGANLSVVSVVPAIAGPFDVGTVVTRMALRLDPITGIAQVDATSEPIPRILAGIPVRLREVRAYVDRPDFTLNPTDCEPTATNALISGASAVARSAFYQASNCAALKFKPELSLKLKGGTKRGDHPALKSVLTYPKGAGYSNIAKAVVTLPPTEFIDNAHIKNPCTRVQFNANQCPKGSLLGTAKAETPLLDEPLEGPVYFRSNGGERLLPDVVVDLNGLFRVTLVGHVDSLKGRIRTTFEGVPDAPVSKFTLSLFGGKRGLLVNSRDLCAKTNRAEVILSAQNGLERTISPVLQSQCKGKGKKAKGPGARRG